MEEKDKIHYIYKTTCIITNRWYIGMHSTFNIDDGYLGSGNILKKSINKYGKENHIREILEYCDNRELLAIREKEIVTAELISESLCMNLVEGGKGWTKSEHHIIACKKGAARHQFLLQNDEDWKSRKSEKQSVGLKRAYRSGIRKGEVNFDWTGKKHTKETIEKLKLLKKDHGIGETNSQYGTYWITNGKENKKIKNNEVIPDGWHRGRTLKKQEERDSNPRGE